MGLSSTTAAAAAAGEIPTGLLIVARCLAQQAMGLSSTIAAAAGEILIRLLIVAHLLQVHGNRHHAFIFVATTSL